MEAAVRPAVLDDPVLARVKRDMQALYGERFEKLILYGSRARGDHRTDSDYDFIVVIGGPYRAWDEIKRIGRATRHYFHDEGIDVSIKPFDASELDERTVFMWDVRKDGIEV
jgi:predicted nucleotidyltransferase